MTLTLKRVSAAAAIIGASLFALGTVFLGNQRLALGLDSPFLPFPDPPTGSQILFYLNGLEMVNGFPVFHPPIPIFNVGECAGPQVTECSNNIDDDGDTLIDEADPACHTDGNAGNPSSYDPTLDDESDFVPQCKDGLDNDNDTFIDAADPGCHTDGNASNPDSYNPNDNSESNAPLPACMDGNDNDGDGLIDFPNDPGCSSLTDTDETNEGGGGGGTENTLPLCSDGTDNDGDSLVDLADPDCAGFMPKLVVVKTVINDNSGTSTVSDFSLHIGTTTSATATVVSGATTTVAVDSWKVGEIQRPAYTATFGGDCNGIGEVSLAIGQTKTCTITNNDVAPSAAQCADGIDNDGDSLVDSADPGCHTDGNADNAGSYDPADNSETDSGGGNGGSGGYGSATTTGTLIVKKLLNGGGTTTPSLFSFTLNGAATTTFESDAQNDLTVATGTYTVLEVATSTYTPSYNNCASVSVSVGSTTMCTISNTLISTTTTDVSVTKSVDKTSPNPGDTVIFTLTVTNNGPNAAPNVVVTDLLPNTLTYISDDASTTSTTYATTTGAWTVGTLANGSSTALHITASVGSGTAGQTITNTASVVSSFTDQNTGNNSASTNITPPAPGGGGVSDNGGGNGGGGDSGSSSGSSSGRGRGGGGGSPSGSGSPSDGQVLGTSTSCDAYLTAFIRSGRANDPEQVRRLQTVLRDFEGAQVAVNGVYDGATLVAVHAFQSKYAADILAPWAINQSTGYVYLTTRKKINEIYCRNTKQFPLSAAELGVILHTLQSEVGAQPSSTLGTPAPSSAGSGRVQSSASGELQPPPWNSSAGGAGWEDADTATETDESELIEATSTASVASVVSDVPWWLWIVLLVLAGFGVGWYFWTRPTLPMG